jgi:hypothetical protein
MFIVISYDIPEDKRRTKIHKVLKSVGWVEERRPEGACRRLTQHFRGFVGFHIRSTQPTILLCHKPNLHESY